MARICISSIPRGPLLAGRSQDLPARAETRSTYSHLSPTRCWGGAIYSRGHLVFGGDGLCRSKPGDNTCDCKLQLATSRNHFGVGISVRFTSPGRLCLGLSELWMYKPEERHFRAIWDLLDKGSHYCVFWISIQDQSNTAIRADSLVFRCAFNRLCRRRCGTDVEHQHRDSSVGDPPGCRR